ncbi:hypothetical protein UFOVP860_6 [uncultured Caudovirales phage]|uniref:Uncharacterized protein n=1 Tax=uncultured Caudovirales phage TaxID=2100421 RepID=A0A6J5P809_9CAUD|nr:hypothetical protein UFOVP860_6 [uncultured Caudovirales phage]CAB4195207.1 hypothetical protein UFOVP1293_9 [uncultured Caudovirales phage]CAB4222396.1 hypothetical protein UFOVP1644_27 [uncultured Caudovirales phage]
MDKLLVLENFHVYIPDGLQPDGERKPDKRITFTKGMTLTTDQIPAGQAAADWIEKGLAHTVAKPVAKPVEKAPA